MTSVAVEHVLVAPTSVFHQLGHFQGFSTETNKYLDGLLRPEHTSYRPRGAMEKDPSFKQLIPYVIFRHRDALGNVSVFQYTRGKGQGEARLHAKRSIGVGGHISAADAACHNPYEEGMRRELEEEVLIDTPYESRLAGMINDDLTDVGKVHLGIVHLCDVAQPNIRPREDEMTAAGFLPVAELLANIDHYETWSQICLRALFA